ncbi:MAG: hypothetical protein LBH29_02675, partial [Elusimicrobiota bacterium]|nr:hypothetical protein [Elusimicrobiota bacterium]
AAIIQERDDWQKYLDQWEGATLRLALAQELKTLQQQRYEENQRLLRRGRTTTNDVIQGEQDLDDAALNVYSTIIELITIYESAPFFYINR